MKKLGGKAVKSSLRHKGRSGGLLSCNLIRQDGTLWKTLLFQKVRKSVAQCCNTTDCPHLNFLMLLYACALHK